MGKDVAGGRRGPEPPGYHQQIIDNLASGVVAVDGEGVILCANPAAADHLGVEPALLTPGHLLEEITYAGPLLAVMIEVMQTRASISRREIILELDSGEKKEIGLSATLLEGPQPFNGVIFLFTDMTERRVLERAAELNRQLAMLGELTAGVVHELRNPVMVVSGMAELLMRALKEDTKEHTNAKVIFEEAQRLERSIAQFLGFARPFDIAPARCNPEDILQRALQLSQRKAEKKQVKLSGECAPGLPEMTADAGRAAQALANIVVNAVDAVEAGSGVVHVEAMRQDKAIVFRVTDNGPGIFLKPGEDLFKPFFTKKESGTGLGLAIAHRIITAHSGAITYRNLDEGGACFEVRLPIQKGALW